MFKLCLLIVAAVALGPQAVKGQLVGAEDAALGEFPYHVFLKARGKVFCSGGLITRRHVLSASHCVVKSYKVWGVVKAVVGTHECTRGGQSYGIEERFLHPEYVIKKSLRGWNFDIGLFQLASVVVLSEHVSLVNLPMSDVQVGTEAVISASGCQKINGPRSPVLQKLTVGVIDQSTCQSMMPNHRIRDTYICTFAGVGRGTCQGDSGAPLVHDGFIIGVLSGGIPCARGFPDIFTNVYRYMRWINEVLHGINTTTTPTPGK